MLNVQRDCTVRNLTVQRSSSPLSNRSFCLQGTRVEQMQRYLHTLLPALVKDPAQLPKPAEAAVQELWAQYHGIAAFRVRFNTVLMHCLACRRRQLLPSSDRPAAGCEQHIMCCEQCSCNIRWVNGTLAQRSREGPCKLAA